MENLTKEEYKTLIDLIEKEKKSFTDKLKGLFK